MIRKVQFALFHTFFIPGNILALYFLVLIASLSSHLLGLLFFRLLSRFHCLLAMGGSFAFRGGGLRFDVMRLLPASILGQQLPGD